MPMSPFRMNFASTWTLLAALIAVCHPAIARSDDSANSKSAWLGHWTGIARDKDEWNSSYDAETPIDIELKWENGKLVLIDRGRMSTKQAAVPVRLYGHQFFAQYERLFTNLADVEGTLSEDGTSLNVTISRDGMTGLESHTARLQRDSVDARRFHAPRLDAQGRRVTDYQYRVPRRMNGEFDVASASAEGINPVPLANMVRRILNENGAIDSPQTESVLILRDGKLVFEEYFWGQSAENPHIISSAQKSVTAMIAGVAWDKHLFQLDDPVISYFPDRQDTWWGRNKYPVTVRNILSMSSGTYWDDSQPPPQNPSVLLLETLDVTGYVLNRPLTRPPGSSYEYNNGLPVLTGELIEKVTKERLDEFAHRNLFAPLGIVNYRWTRNRQGDPMAAGGSYFRTRDLGKLGQLMLNEGRWGGEQILSKDWIRESTRKQTAEGEYNYGFYWHLSKGTPRHIDKYDGYEAIGQGDQFIAVLPKPRVVVVITSQNWARSAAGREPENLINQYIVPSIKNDTR
jgi:CubicO group peptidase (beta-lactamase class C family)